MKQILRNILPLCTLFVLTIIGTELLAADTVTMRVECIQADNSGDKVDPELKALAADLESVLKFSSLSLLKRSELVLEKKHAGQVSLPSGQVLRAEYLGRSEEKVRIKLKIEQGQEEIFATTLLVANQGSALIGGPSLKEGVLILRVMVRY